MIKKYMESFTAVLNGTVITGSDGKERDHTKAMEDLCADLLKFREARGTLFMIGNGGSSGVVSHSSVDFINTCQMKAYPLTDSSLITCMANDNGYENVFSVPLGTMCGPGDALIAVSSSGSSLNIVNAAETGKEKGALVITLSGFQPNNPLRQEGAYNFWLDSGDYGQVEIGHGLLLHILTDTLKQR